MGPKRLWQARLRLRIFTRTKEILLGHKEILLRLEKIEKKLLQENSTNKKQENEIAHIFETLNELLSSNNEPRKKLVTEEKMNKSKAIKSNLI